MQGNLRRVPLVGCVAVLLAAAAGLTGCADGSRQPTPSSSANTSIAWINPKPPAPPIEDVRRELVKMREGTGISVPTDLKYGVPVPLFRLAKEASGHKVADLIDPDRIAFYYPLLSSRGLEGELTYAPWDDSPLLSRIGDSEGSVPESESVTADYKRYIADLPRISGRPVTGILSPSAQYVVAVAMTPNSSVGVFYPSGLGGMAVPGNASLPYVPTGVVFRNEELARQVLIASGGR